jgi:hypothetical protein
MTPAKRIGSLTLAVLAGLAITTASASAFSVKNVKMHSDGKRLTYSLTICTTSKATLKLTGTFSGSGLSTAKPGATQYQSKGCWPAAVSVPVVKTQATCAPAACGAVRGKTYRGRVFVTDTHTKRSSSTARRQTRA